MSAVRAILSDVTATLDLADTLRYKPLRDEIVSVAQRALHTASELLEAQKGLAPSVLEPARARRGTETPPPSPIEVNPDTVTDMRSVASASTSRSVTMYRSFLSEILPTLKRTFPTESPQMCMRRAAALWQWNKGKGSLEKILKSTHVSIRASATAPAAPAQRTLVVEECLPSSSRFRSMSAESELDLPPLEAAE
jgi:hypothetical protein